MSLPLPHRLSHCDVAGRIASGGHQSPQVPCLIPVMRLFGGAGWVTWELMSSPRNQWSACRRKNDQMSWLALTAFDWGPSSWVYLLGRCGPPGHSCPSPVMV